MKITLKINGNEEVVDVAEGTPLLWVLRDRLDLTGTKFGCGKGLCGACTVHLNGEAVRSCQEQEPLLQSFTTCVICGRAQRQQWETRVAILAQALLSKYLVQAS